MSDYVTYSDNATENVYLNAAHALGIPFREVRGARRYWVLGGPENPVYLDRARLGVNPGPLASFTLDKAASQGWLREHGFPVPEFLLHSLYFDGNDDVRPIREFAARRFPVVVKANALSRAMGVFTDIRGDGELMRVLAYLGRLGIRDLLVEEYVPGRIYRSIVFDDEVIDVAEWILSRVVGDGTSTVRELVAALNEAERGGQPVAVDVRLVDLLEKQGLRLDSVVDRGTPVRVVEAGVRRGARRHRVPLAAIPGENLELLLSARSTIGARLLGIDFICADATLPWRDQVFAINEVNSAPGFGLSYAGVEENDFAPVSRILEKLFLD